MQFLCLYSTFLYPPPPIIYWKSRNDLHHYNNYNNNFFRNPHLSHSFTYFSYSKVKFIGSVIMKIKLINNINFVVHGVEFRYLPTRGYSYALRVKFLSNFHFHFINTTENLKSCWDSHLQAYSKSSLL